MVIFFTLQQLHWCETLISSAWFLINGPQSLEVLYNGSGYRLHCTTVFIFLQENIDSLSQEHCSIWELGSWNLKAKWPLWLSQRICKTLSQGSGIQKFMSQAWSIVYPISEKLKILGNLANTRSPHIRQQSRIGRVKTTSSSRTEAVKTAAICLKKKKAIQ